MNGRDTNDHGLSRREFVQGAVAGAVLAATPRVALADDGRPPLSLPAGTSAWATASTQFRRSETRERRAR
jgi:hypothetical protein